MTEISLSKLQLNENGKMSKLLIDSIIICCSQNIKISHFLFARMIEELQSFAAADNQQNVKRICSDLKILQCFYKNAERICVSSRLSLDWLDKANKNILSQIARICLTKNDDINEHIIDTLNAICQQNIVNFNKKDMLKMIECILSILRSLELNDLSLDLFCKLSHLLISIKFNYDSLLRHVSAPFCLALKRMIAITVHHIEKNDNLLFVEQCSRMLCIIMRQSRDQNRGFEQISSKYVHIEQLLQDKHALVIHSDQLLLEFVYFINENPIQSVQKRMLMPAIFAIIDTLNFENIQKTGNCIDQILFALPNKLKPTLKDIYSQYHRSKS